ncbi:hypothetical protein J6590_069683 [Homalodisca vitripennis]|nr:hypothetical protein J6590_069683 [Homalodisca vitripennis]
MIDHADRLQGPCLAVNYTSSSHCKLVITAMVILFPEIVRQPLEPFPEFSTDAYVIGLADHKPIKSTKPIWFVQLS